jgi:hypothetical protein
MRRLVIDHRDHLHRHLVVGPRQDDRRGVGKTDLRRTCGNLFNGVGRTLPAYNLNVEICVLVVTLLQRDEIVSVASEISEVRNELYFVRSVLCSPSTDLDQPKLR